MILVADMLPFDLTGPMAQRIAGFLVLTAVGLYLRASISKSVKTFDELPARVTALEALPGKVEQLDKAFAEHVTKDDAYHVETGQIDVRTSERMTALSARVKKLETILERRKD